MNMNQNHSIISDIVVHREEIAYKRSYYRQEVQLEFKEASHHFLHVVTLNTNTQFHQLLKHYAIKNQNNNRVVFEKREEGSNYDHTEFIRRIQKFLDSFGVVAISQPHSCEKSLGELRQRILNVDERVGVSWQVENLEVGTKNLFIYYPKACVKAIDMIVDEYLVAKRQILVYSLNSFIKKEIKICNFKSFILKLHELYALQIKSLCDSKYNHRKKVNLTVLGVNTVLISPQNQRQDWNKHQKRGIYGLEFDVYGEEHQFLRFYSLVQAFFNNLNYVIKMKAEINLYHKDTDSLLHNANLRALVFSEIIVIFDPPDNLDSIIKQINKKKWTFVPKDFLNMDFQMFFQYKRQYLTKLRAKNGLVVVGIRVQSDIIEFQADQQACKCIKILSKQFLQQMKGQEKLLSFLKQKEDVEILKKYYLQNCNFQLIWMNDSAFLKCCRKDMDESYNKIQQFYKISRKKRYTLLSKMPIYHNLVKCQKTLAQYSYFPSHRYKLQELYLTLRPINDIYQQKCLCFIINSQQSNNEMKGILLRNYQAIKKYSEYDMKQVCTQNQLKLQSIYIIKMSNKDNPYVKPEKITRIIEALIIRNVPICIVLPGYNFELYQSIFKVMLQHVAYRKSAIENKQIFVFIPTLEQQKDPIEGIFHKISKIIRKCAQFVKVSKYFLSSKHIIEGKNLNLVRLRCNIKDQTINCTSLNSFIFKSELQSKRNTNFRVGIFVPKIQSKEYLVCLITGQTFEVNRFNVQRIQINSIFFKSTIQILKNYFQKQNYAVLYYNPTSKSFPTSLYVYDSQTSNTMRRFKLNIPQKKISEGNETISFNLKCERQDCYLLETHRLFERQLQGILEKEEVRQ